VRGGEQHEKADPRDVRTYATGVVFLHDELKR
jgi:hypothetical protein